MKNAPRLHRAARRDSMGVILWIFCVLWGGELTAQETPRFRSSVDVTSLDASVVDRSGRPITNLGPDAFAVRIDGKPRRVVSAEWVSLVRSPSQPIQPVPSGYTTNEGAVDG